MNDITMAILLVVIIFWSGYGLRYMARICKNKTESNRHMKMKIWITTYWTTEIEPVVTPFDNQEAAETCASYYKRLGYKVCIDECDIFHKCIDTESEE